MVSRRHPDLLQAGAGVAKLPESQISLTVVQIWNPKCLESLSGNMMHFQAFFAWLKSPVYDVKLIMHFLLLWSDNFSDYLGNFFIWGEGICVSPLNCLNYFKPYSRMVLWGCQRKQKRHKTILFSTPQRNSPLWLPIIRWHRHMKL